MNDIFFWLSFRSTTLLTSGSKFAGCSHRDWSASRHGSPEPGGNEVQEKLATGKHRESYVYEATVQNVSRILFVF